MSQDPAAPPARSFNPLLLPLLMVSFLAVAEGFVLVLLIILLALRPHPTPSIASAEAPAGQQAVAPDRQPPAARSFVTGKKGQRVESGGVSITVEQVKTEPQYKTLADWGSDYRYLAVLIVVENNSGGNIQLLPATFRLQDDQGYPYQQRGLKLTGPELDLAVLGNREKVKGYLDFTIPKTAKGLHLVYWGTPTHNSQPIHIDLGE